MDQRTPIQRLMEELHTGSPAQLLEVANQCEQTPNIQITKAILLLNNKNYQEAQQLLKGLKDHPLYPFTRLYQLYAEGQYQLVVTESRKNIPEDQLLLGQAFLKLGEFEQAIQLFQKLLKDSKFQKDSQDILTNIANAAIQQNDENQMRQINSQITEFIKKNKNQYARELLLNHALLNLQLNDVKTAKELTIRFENMVKVENEQDEDLFLAQLILDVINPGDYKSKVKQYELLEKTSEQAVLLNNLAVFQEFIHPHHDSLKRVEEALSSDYKFTPSQLNVLKINKAILQIIKNRPTKEHGLPLSVQIAINRQKWEQPIEDPYQYLIFATNNDNTNKIIELCNVKNWNQNKVLSTFILAHILKLPDDSPYDKQIQLIAQFHKSLVCNYYIKRSNLQKALQYYTDDQQIKSQLALLCIEKGQLEQGAKFIDSLQYDGITDMNEIENLERNIGLSKKVEVQVKKIQKKKKKRIRYPKNFDKTNPGPLPNPERWLPKYDRKEWKKKKQIHSRTQGGNAGNETVNTFKASGASTAQVSAAQKKTNKYRK
ncbi:unnamed protein product (macronuclear) [Paramecium tetraurelia]|uniref:Signal recognition particle subunit SRP72 n=1 Tax=Paramecium tetraurelia TaxID=5888 RepID=A0CE94_PARTE|nr:uncharacterized protein GSPATT00037547001 [Paramecium tetraurelia]CAK69111.1 unnamed protein product [Paramecium tetraurelia]|eukprot:XP_001436508.1 hypothetical protein (macronuclear) [Paramecium tetraurelia strain d4-2]